MGKHTVVEKQKRGVLQMGVLISEKNSINPVPQ